MGPQGHRIGGSQRGRDEPPDFDRIVARVSRRLSRSWDEIEDTLTIDRWQAYEREWRECPPVDELVAHYLGYEKPVDIKQLQASGQIMDAAAFAQWVKATGGRKLDPSS
ncbi:MAG: hypothetical protein V4564_07790 [Pseudomonadota bacterium]